MPMKLFPFAVAAVALAVLPAHAGAATTEAVQCALDQAEAVACTLSDTVDQDGLHHMAFTAGNRETAFVGRSQSGWWSGTLDGKPAMGYELNRGHVVFSTTDLRTRFEWWSRGHRHGTY